MTQSGSSHIISFDQLSDFAKQIASQLKERDVISLVGEIGAGKTSFTFALARELGLDLSQAFSSPTFTILNQYEMKYWHMNHVDLYRLRSFSELEQLDILPLFEQPKTITLIEWGDKFEDMQYLYTKKIIFQHIPDQPLERLVEVNIFS